MLHVEERPQGRTEGESPGDDLRLPVRLLWVGWLDDGVRVCCGPQHYMLQNLTSQHQAGYKSLVNGLRPSLQTGIEITVQVCLSSDQIRSVAQSCPTLYDPMNRSTPGLPVHHQLPELTQTHVHRVSDAIQPSHPLSSPSPPAPNPSQHQSLFQWVSSSHEVAKVLDFQL